MAGLYGDLPQAKNASESSSSTPAWGATPVLQPTRKPAALAPPPSILRGARGGGRTPVGGRGGAAAAGRGASQSALLAGSADAKAGPADGAGPGTVSIFASVQDEYDPMRPNDYEVVLKERERARREAEAEAERVAKLKEVEAHLERLKKQEEPGPGPGSAGLGAGGAASDSSSLTSTGSGLGLGMDPYGSSGGGGGGGLGLGAGGGPAGDAGGRPPGGGGGAGGGAGAGSEKGMTLAQKLLMKMGWKEGEGLGRERQGISTPLIMQKTNARAGVIVNAEPQLPAGGPPDKKPRTGVQIVGKPSRVLCLRNMVGPGEVDEELEEEVGVECTKYGPVSNVMIFEVTQAGFQPEEAVRIFIEFERHESAMKAFVDMQGRFFAGREVRAAFFPEERFASMALAPAPGEFD